MITKITNDLNFQVTFLILVTQESGATADLPDVRRKNQFSSSIPSNITLQALRISSSVRIKGGASRKAVSQCMNQSIITPCSAQYLLTCSTWVNDSSCKLIINPSPRISLIAGC